ncbi:MAG: hypothetical protein JXB15_11045 [Anaerolineales bacterium]|nr:hypothetical protein [Anaerolineales bacterium]
MKLKTVGLFVVLAAYPRPSVLAISADGHRLYVTHLLDRTVTILTVQPFTNYLPLAWQGEHPVDQHPAPSTAVQSETLQDGPGFPPVILSLWPDSNLVQSAVISPDEQHLVIPHTRSNTGNHALTFDPVALAEYFPNLDLIARDDLVAGLSDTISINILLTGHIGEQTVSYANDVVFQGNQVFIDSPSPYLPGQWIYLPALRK